MPLMLLQQLDKEKSYREQTCMISQMVPWFNFRTDAGANPDVFGLCIKNYNFTNLLLIIIIRNYFSNKKKYQFL